MIAMRVAMRSTDMVSSFAYSDTWERGRGRAAKKRGASDGAWKGPYIERSLEECLDRGVSKGRERAWMGAGGRERRRAPLQGCGV
jgi:hypothetical protein